MESSGLFFRVRQRSWNSQNSLRFDHRTKITGLYQGASVACSLFQSS